MTAPWPSRFFSPAELACKCGNCGGRADIDGAFLARLDRLRERANRPLTVHSGYRCERHPSEAGKTTMGAHRQGRAVDIRATGPEAYRLIAIALELGFTGIGIQQKSGLPPASRFVHLDDAPSAENQPRPTLWSY